MVGITTKFATLDLLRSRLLSSSQASHQALGHLLETHASYAYFGALGTSYGDFSPVRVPESNTIGSPGSNPYVRIWKLIFHVFGGEGTSANPGLKPVLDRIRKLLGRLDTIAADEDLESLKEMKAEIGAINQIAADLTAVITTIKGDGTLANLGIVPEFAELISQASRPPIIRPRPDGKVGFPARFWPLRDFLSWRRSGRFAQELWRRAKASGKEEYLAYALGWLSSWALSAGGGSALASIIGAPFRNQWWRARFVSNYADLWSHGYAQVHPSTLGASPTPPYSAWPNLCEAELQQKILLPGASLQPEEVMKHLRLGQPLTTALSGEFTDYWVATYEAVYGDLGGERPRVDADTLQDAYGMAWLVLWFQTGKDSLGCHAHMPAAPVSCGGAPSWSNPTVPGDAGGGASVPPAPSVDPKVKEANVVCAIILAIIGVALFATGGFAAGGAAIAGAIALAADAGTIDWDKFRCDLAWYRLYLYNGLRALHDLLSLGAMLHPYTHELGEDETSIELLEGVLTRFETGQRILLTRPQREGYPVVPWNGAGYSWFNSATGATEAPGTQPALAAVYPSGFMDDPTNPLGGDSPFQAGAWPFQDDGGGTPRGFANAVDSLLDWLNSEAGDLPDWNLDGDRGLGYQTWAFLQEEWTNPVNIKPEP